MVNISSIHIMGFENCASPNHLRDNPNVVKVAKIMLAAKMDTICLGDAKSNCVISFKRLFILAKHFEKSIILR